MSLPAKLMGRLATGEERGQGRTVHLVPAGTTQYGHVKAMCGAQPGQRSGGWDVEHCVDRPVTCARCQRRASVPAGPVNSFPVVAGGL